MTGRLTALLDTLLPGDGADWPAAGAHGLAVHAATLADDMLGGAEAMAGVLDALPQGFADLPQLRREEFLHRLRHRTPRVSMPSSPPPIMLTIQIPRSAIS